MCHATGRRPLTADTWARSQANDSGYEVCSKSMRIGIVVVVHWVGCVCNQSWHVRKCRSNSYHKLRVAAFAQLAVVGRGSNTCVYVTAIFTMCESTEQRICIKFCFKIWKTAMETYQLLRQHTLQMQWVVHKCLTGSVDLKRVEPPLKVTPARDDRQHRETRKLLLKLEQSFAVKGDRQYERSRMTVRRLRESVRPKRPEKWRDGDWILHHDNAPAHTSHLVQQFLAKHGTAQPQQPTYSPDLEPCDFFLFPRLKKVLKGHRFEATEDIKRNSTKTLLDIPKEEFAKCFQQWQQCWAKCVAAKGNGVEDS